MEPGASDWWSVHCGSSPIIATAIHNGDLVRPAAEKLMAISKAERLREEDPFTGFFIRDVPNRIIFHRSRFEIDLNRAREKAVYVTPDQAWGINVWKDKPGKTIIEESLQLHDAYYSMLRGFLTEHQKRHNRFVVLDVHSYNHRRDGPNAPHGDPKEMPEINIGTSSMDRDRWAFLIDPFIEKLRAFKFRGRSLDVRENISFQGKGEQTRFIHEAFPESGCAIAIEFKKIFMDEWTGLPDGNALKELRMLVASTLAGLEEALRTVR
ncbi:N-formylglutamate amidohydrolase [Phyllobacterium sp. YR531]|uniref:N-formylglutamate amidohydrolase n=1 Tax=Phyllobacterium sp. YR531 TaxID=1144343 RepID=UPI00026F52A1|nr:N-formylglutamate amidohydrolase [Phyllobacterium sp. YR531]EJN02470.1 N-formylglutamate amidohydrolase [Phyllobacterium sp. YR531]